MSLLFTFRNTAGYRTGGTAGGDDAAGTNVVIPTTPQYSAGQGFGYLSTPPSGNDLSLTIDPRLGGQNTISSHATRFRVDMANGNYKLLAATGQNGVSVRHQLFIWDGGLFDGATGVTSVTTWAAATTISGTSGSPKYAIIIDSAGVANLLKTITTGTTGASFVPTAGAGPWTDGGVTWTLVKKAVVSADSVGNNPSGSVMDASGASQTFANWPSLGALSTQFAVTQGFVEMTRGNDGVNYIRHLSFVAQTTALQDVTFTSRRGVTSASAPTILAGQPAGRVVFWINVFTGSAAPSAISFGGSLAPYLTPALVNGKLAAVSAGPIPDSMAGAQTLSVIQTDASGSITGSPRTTTPTGVTVASSQGKPRDNSLYGVISTDTWLAMKPALDLMVAEWNPNPTTFASDVQVTSPSQLSSQYANLAAIADGTSWYRIRIAGAGNWSTYASFAPAPKDWGSGGILIEPDAGFTDQLNMKVVLDGARRFYLRNLTFVPIKPTASPGGGSYQNVITIKVPSTTIYTLAKLENNQIGRGFVPGYNSATDALQVTGTTKSYQPNGIVCYHAEQLIAVGNKLYGVSDAELIFGARYAHMANDVRDALGDAGGQGNFYYLGTPQNVFLDNNTYLIRETTHQTPYDHWDQFTPSHPDLNQSRAPEGAWNDIGNGGTVTAGDLTITADGRRYTAATSGTRGATEPTHTSGTASDGGVSWTFTGYMSGSFATRGKQVVVNLGNHAVCPGTTVNGSNVGPEVQLYLDSGRGCYSTDFIALNTIVATASGYGVGNASRSVTTPGETYVEQCVMVGPPTLNSAQSINEKFIDGGYGYTVAANNIIGIQSGSPFVSNSGTGVLLVEGNVAVQWTSGAASPHRAGDNLIGTFGTDGGGRATFTLTDNLSVTPAQMRAALEAALLTPTKVVGARTKTASFSPQLTETLAGAIGSPRLTSLPTLVFKDRP